MRLLGLLLLLSRSTSIFRLSFCSRSFVYVKDLTFVTHSIIRAAMQALATKDVEGYYRGLLTVVAENIYLCISVLFWHNILAELFIIVLL